MADSIPTPPDPVEQLRQHVESLRLAGIAWLPRQVEISVSVVSEPEAIVTPASAPVSLPTVNAPSSPDLQTSLFAQGSSVSTPVPATREERLASLDALRARVAACTRCPNLASTRTQTVFGVGPLDPDLCFLGEAPGADEDVQGEPFVGAAGQLLNRIINACGMCRDEVFIVNILRCRPPGNRQPTPQEADNCREYLDQTLDLVRPRIICALGATAVQSLLGVTQGITRLRGRWLEYRDIPVMPTFHPAYLLRTPAGKKDVWEDMKTILARLGRTIPGARNG